VSGFSRTFAGFSRTFAGFSRTMTGGRDTIPELTESALTELEWRRRRLAIPHVPATSG
jgi:hypothetical protein